MVKQDCTRNGERISRLEVKSEEHDSSRKEQLKFIIKVNDDAVERDKGVREDVDRHQGYFALFIGGWSAVVAILSILIALKQLGVIK